MRNRHTEDSKNVRDNLDRAFIKIIIKISYIIFIFFGCDRYDILQNVVITCIYKKETIVRIILREVSIWEIIRQQRIDIRMLKVQDFTDIAERAVS